MQQDMTERMIQREQRKTRMRSIIMLSLIFHLSAAMVYLFLPIGPVPDDQSDTLAFDVFTHNKPPPERRNRPKPPLSKKLLDPKQNLAKDAEKKRFDAAKNERDEVVKLSERIVIHDVEVNNAPVEDLIPDLMTDAKLREAEASNLSRLVAQPGRTDGQGIVTGRVRPRGDGSGRFRGISDAGGGDGRLDGGGRSGMNDPLGMIKFLNSLDGPQDVVYCLDISASMQAAGLNKLELAINAVKDSVLMLGSDDNFNIIPFSTTARMMSEKLLAANELNIKRALNYLNTFTPETIQYNRGTNILAALDRGLKDNSTVIFLVTDGLPTTIKGQDIETDTETILEYVRQRNTKKARIFVVALEVDPIRSPGGHLLTSLAYEHNGEIKIVGSEKLNELNKQTGKNK
ncbi:VWA domain-containing protein [Candidatus Poribacteria bacterium]|nr:VWA domain-containing protein [Candidatus Poribacteria bacterium]